MFSKAIAPVFDLDFDMRLGPHTPRVIRDKMTMTASLGFKRVYLIAPPPGYPMNLFSVNDLYANADKIDCFGLQSVLHTGDSTLWHIHEAHRAGVEAFVIMKPYEGGGLYTIPHNSEPSVPRLGIERLGGIGIGYDPFLVDNPEMRLKRKSIKDYDDLVKLPIDKIEIAFCIESVRQTTSPNCVLTYDSVDDNCVTRDPIQNITIWTSSDNGTYQRYDKELNVREYVEKREILDANGIAVHDTAMRCRILELTGFEISSDIRYLAVTFRQQDKKLITIPFSMIKAYARNREVPITCGCEVRPTPLGFGKDIDDNSPVFQRVGFDVEAIHSMFWGPGWHESDVYSIARGKVDYIRGGFCEAYPQVREHWLDQIEQFIAMGADGIDIRLQCHSAGVTDYMAYGYNDVLVEAYREKYGVDINEQCSDPEKMMKLRGDFFMLFLIETRRRLSKADKRLQLHLQHCHEKTDLSSDFGEAGFWAMPKVVLDWKRAVDLVDEVTIKDYNFGTYQSQKCRQIKDYAASRGKAVWINCYLQQGWDLNDEFVASVEADKSVSGMLLYEMIHNKNNYGGTSKGLMGITPDHNVYWNPDSLNALKKYLSS